MRSFNLAYCSELNVLDSNIARTKHRVVSRGVNHKLELNAAYCEVKNKLCGLTCGDLEEGAAPSGVGEYGLTVHSCGDVSCGVVACEGRIEHINTNLNHLGAVVGNLEVEVILTCNRIGNVHLDGLICAAVYIGVGYAGLVAVDYYVILGSSCEGGSDGLDCGPIDLGILATNGRSNYGRIERCANCAGSDPLILGAVIINSALVFAHPAISSLVATPIVGEHSTCGRGELINVLNVSAGLNAVVSGYLIYGHAVNEPGDGILCPTEAVSVEFLGSIEAEVVHILVATLAVNEEVELNLGGILAEELDIDLVMGVSYTVLKIVRTCANEEGAGSTGISRGLHRNLVITVVVVVLSASLARGVFELYILVVKPSVCLLFGYAKTHNTVCGIVNYVVLLPYNVEYVTVRPTVRFEQDVRIYFILEIYEHLRVQGRSSQLNGFSEKKIEERASGERHDKC